jgi:phosphotransferase system IIB component
MSQADQIVAGLGGHLNIVEVEACITRLRTRLRDVTLIDERALRSGPGADKVAVNISDMLWSES